MITLRRFSLALATVGLLCTTAAHAQLMDKVKGALGGGAESAESAGSGVGASSGGGLGLDALGGGGSAMPSLSSATTGNTAGLLEFCIKNNYLGNDASSVKDKLLGKLGGQEKAESDSGYQQGLGGVLSGEGGSKMDLSGGGLKEKITEKVCDQVLEHGSSLL